MIYQRYQIRDIGFYWLVAELDKVEKILCIDKNLFLQSIYVQGEIENLVRVDPAIRKVLISKLVGIEDMQKAWVNMRDVIGEYQRIVDNLTTRKGFTDS